MVRRTNLDDAKIRELVEAGCKVSEIAEKLEVSPSAVYSRIYVLGLQGHLAQRGSRKQASEKAAEHEPAPEVKTRKPRREKGIRTPAIDIAGTLEDQIADAMRNWAAANADKLLWLAGEKRIFYTVTGFMPTQILEPYIDKTVQEIQGRDWYIENGEVKRKR